MALASGGSASRRINGSIQQQGAVLAAPFEIDSNTHDTVPCLRCGALALVLGEAVFSEVGLDELPDEKGGADDDGDSDDDGSHERYLRSTCVLTGGGANLERLY